MATSSATDDRPQDGRRSAAAARRRAREAEIVAATRRLFDDKGVREAHIDDIAKAVGINRAIVYRHFTGKEDLFALTMVSYLDELAELLEPPRAGPHARDRLTAVVTAFADYALAHPAFVDCAQALMRRPGSELLDEVSERRPAQARPRDAACLDSLLAERSRTASTTGDFKVKDPTLLANTLYASGLGALQLARVGILVIRESAPGVPVVGEISADQVSSYMVATALAARRPLKVVPVRPQKSPGRGAAPPHSGVSFVDRCATSSTRGQRSRIATTPWPPAAQIEISAAAGALLGEQLGGAR